MTTPARPVGPRLTVLGVITVLAGVLVAITVFDRPSSDNDQADPLHLGQSFQYQLSELPVDVSVDADVFDIDLFETPAATVEQLHARGRTVVCYLSAGSFEPVRPDAGLFPADALGEPLIGFEDERWLDIRRIDDLMPIIEDRLDQCARKGFDGVEFDECDQTRPFLDQEKPVFIVEYASDMAVACDSVPLGATVISKDLALDTALETYR